MRRELQTEQMRRRILDSALEVFGAEGYDGASMNAICTRAGISKGIIYHYFAAMPFALLALVPIWLYRGRQGCHSKPFQYACYAFYPVHMLLLVLALNFVNR